MPTEPTPTQAKRQSPRRLRPFLQKPSIRWSCLAVLVLGGGLWSLALPVPPATAFAAEARGDKTFDEHIRPFLERHCLTCHKGEKAKGDLRLEQLAPDFTDKAN